MFKIIDTDGELKTSEGIDIHVWYDAATGAVELTAHPMYYVDEEWHTNLDSVLFWAQTGFNPEDYRDEWYGYSHDTLPSDMPMEVRFLVAACIDEVNLADTPVYADVLTSSHNVR